MGLIRKPYNLIGLQVPKSSANSRALLSVWNDEAFDMSTSTPRETSKTRPRRVLPSLPEGGEEVRRTSSGGGGNGERLPSQSSIKEASTR